MTGHVVAWIYFAVAWLFVLLVAFRRWKERERADQKATEDALEHTAPPAPIDHRWDVM